MAKILSSTSINGNVAKMVELPDEFIINGQIYDKSTLNPKPLQFCPVTSSAWNEMVTSEYSIIDDDTGTNNYTYMKTNSAMMIDNINPNISYVIKPNNAGILYVTKITRNGTDSTVLEYNVTLNAHGVGEFIDQDDSYIYILHNINGAQTSYGYNRITKINKTTMALTNAYDFGIQKTVTFLTANATDIYVFVNDLNLSRAYVYKYNKLAQTCSAIFQEDMDTINSTEKIVCSKMNALNQFYLAGSGFNLTGVRSTVIKRYELSIADNKVYVKNMTIDFSAVPFNSLPYIGTHSVFNAMYIHEDAGVQYITLVKTSRLKNNSNYIYVFQLTPSDTLKVLQEENFYPNIFYSSHQVNNGEGLIVYNETTLLFYAWNKNKKLYEKSNSFIDNIKIVGIDYNDNVWIFTQDKVVSALSKAMPLKISAQLEFNYYEYKGLDISTNMTVFAENFFGQYVTADLDIYINGPALFDNGTKKITVTTSNTGVSVIPVTVKGGGYITLNTQVN